MLKRNKVLAGFLVVVMLCAGIGFAAVSDELTATGGFAFDASESNNELKEQVNANVYFVQAGTSITSSNSSANGGSVTVGDVDTDNVNDLLTISIPDTAWLKQGDTVTVVAQIKNDNAAPVKLEIAGLDSVNAGSYKDYISVATTGSDTRIEGTDNATVTFIFTLNRVPATSIVATDGMFSFTITATTLDN